MNLMLECAEGGLKITFSIPSNDDAKQLEQILYLEYTCSNLNGNQVCVYQSKWVRKLEYYCGNLINCIYVATAFFHDIQWFSDWLSEEIVNRQYL